MLTFMGVSAFILDTVHVMGGHVFWLIQPFRQPTTPLTNNNNEEEKDQEICLHTNSTCESYVWQALKNYSSIGICLEIIKALYSNFGLICRSPTVGLMQSAKRINPRFLLFVTGYPTLYRVCRFLYFECHAKCNIILRGFLTESLDFSWPTVSLIGISENRIDGHMQRLLSSGECRIIFSPTNYRFLHMAWHRRSNWLGHAIYGHSTNHPNNTSMHRPYHLQLSSTPLVEHLCTTPVFSIHGWHQDFCFG